MMKRNWILSMILTIMFAFSTNGYSLHLITVTINPTIDPLYGNNITGGTFNALVTVTNTSSTTYQYFQLQTEPFISFNSISTLSNSWSSALSAGGLQLFGPPPLAPGASFSFVMNYTFASGISALNAPWSSTSVWSMNGTVAHAYVEIGGFIYTQGSQSFSTGVIPEPGTIILLGFGLLGLGFFTRMRKKRDS